MSWKRIKQKLFKQWIDYSEVSEWYYKARLLYKRKFGNFNYILRIYKNKYHLVFNDEFKMFDRSNWGVGLSWGRVHPDQAFQYSDESCVNIVANRLELTNRYELKDGIQWEGQEKEFEYHTTYTHGEIESKHKFYKGIFEIRCSVPMNVNATTAFWLVAEDVREIDIFEFFPKGDSKRWKKQYITPHWTDLVPATYSDKVMSPKSYKLPVSVATKFNTYTLVWDDDKLEFLFNGLVIRRITNKKLLKEFDKPMSIVIGNGLTTEPLIIDKNLPKSPFMVDYVKVWQR